MKSLFKKKLFSAKCERSAGLTWLDRSTPSLASVGSVMPVPVGMLSIFMTTAGASALARRPRRRRAMPHCVLYGILMYTYARMKIPPSQASPLPLLHYPAPLPLSSHLVLLRLPFLYVVQWRNRLWNTYKIGPKTPNRVERNGISMATLQTSLVYAAFISLVAESR